MHQSEFIDLFCKTLTRQYCCDRTSVSPIIHGNWEQSHHNWGFFLPAFQNQNQSTADWGWSSESLALSRRSMLLLTVSAATLKGAAVSAACSLVTCRAFTDGENIFDFPTWRSSRKSALIADFSVHLCFCSTLEIYNLVNHNSIIH